MVRLTHIAGFGNSVTSGVSDSPIRRNQFFLDPVVLLHSRSKD